ncbi:hypothetical protein [uncultured Serinicoccus sp.]|uniref:hypothetical protein n=1 Tax=uncultured Serinicoccus sp. TaxID=735514 RepID=UPI002625B13D|nr:hypothetical protein [uncultured Serinicoccus sp.]
MSSTRVRLASLVAVGMLTLTGCSDAPGDGSATPAPSTAAPTTAEPVATTEAPVDDAETASASPELSAEDQDAADIEETLQLYTRALDDAFNGDASVEAIYPFSRDTAREKWVTQVMASEAQGTTSTGLTDLEVLDTSVDADIANVTACADVSDVEVMDENGDSIVPESRLDRTLKDFVLERDDSAQLGWYVVEDTNRNEPCDG